MANPFKDYTVHLDKEEMVYQEGEPGTIMYVIQSGAVELFRDVDGRRISYGVLEKGDFFGEMSLLLESQPRTTSAVVVEEADLVEINATLFDKMIRGNIEIAVRMMRKISLRLREYEERRETPEPALSTARVPPGPEEAGEEEAVPPPPPPGKTEVHPKPRPVAPPPAAPPVDAKLPPGTFAVFRSDDGKTQFALKSDSCAIGRFDPVTGMRPEVDLSAVDINRSVSRHHARLLREGNDFSLTEEVGALNGTFINGKRLTTGKPGALRDGDEVGLGMVRLRFQVIEAS